MSHGLQRRRRRVGAGGLPAAARPAGRQARARPGRGQRLRAAVPAHRAAAARRRRGRPAVRRRHHQLAEPRDHRDDARPRRAHPRARGAGRDDARRDGRAPCRRRRAARAAHAGGGRRRGRAGRRRAADGAPPARALTRLPRAALRAERRLSPAPVQRRRAAARRHRLDHGARTATCCGTRCAARCSTRCPDDTWVYPGHGPDTTVGSERARVLEPCPVERTGGGSRAGAHHRHHRGRPRAAPVAARRGAAARRADPPRRGRVPRVRLHRRHRRGRSCRRPRAVGGRGRAGGALRPREHGARPGGRCTSTGRAGRRSRSTAWTRASGEGRGGHLPRGLRGPARRARDPPGPSAGGVQQRGQALRQVRPCLRPADRGVEVGVDEDAGDAGLRRARPRSRPARRPSTVRRSATTTGGSTNSRQ